MKLVTLTPHTHTCTGAESDSQAANSIRSSNDWSSISISQSPLNPTPSRTILSSPLIRKVPASITSTGTSPLSRSPSVRYSNGHRGGEDFNIVIDDRNSRTRAVVPVHGDKRNISISLRR